MLWQNLIVFAHSYSQGMKTLAFLLTLPRMVKERPSFLRSSVTIEVTPAPLFFKSCCMWIFIHVLEIGLKAALEWTKCGYPHALKHTERITTIMTYNISTSEMSLANFLHFHAQLEYVSPLLAFSQVPFLFIRDGPKLDSTPHNLNCFLGTMVRCISTCSVDRQHGGTRPVCHPSGKPDHKGREPSAGSHCCILLALGVELCVWASIQGILHNSGALA